MYRIRRSMGRIRSNVDVDRIRRNRGDKDVMYKRMK